MISLMASWDKRSCHIVPKVEERIRNFKGTVLFTRDTHEIMVLDTTGRKETSGTTLYPEHRRLADQNELDSSEKQTIEKKFWFYRSAADWWQ